MDFSYEVKFTPAQIERILTDYATAELVRGAASVTSCKFNVSRRSLGYGPGESTETYFSGASITIDSTK